MAKLQNPNVITSLKRLHEYGTKQSPNCTCLFEPVLDYQLREFRNGTLHVFRYCKRCGTRAQSPVKRSSIPLVKWRELLIASGREVCR